MSAIPAALAEPDVADRLAEMPDGESYEVVDGQMQVRTMSLESTRVALNVGSELRTWLKANPLGLAFGSEAQYRCFPHREDQVRRPDVSVILKSRLPAGPLPTGFVGFRPDLAVEVVSPNDKADDIFGRMNDFRRAGTPLFWVVYPTGQRVFAHSAAGVREFGVEDIIDAEPILPGFRARVADFFAA